ncbi:MAG TPA: malate synthase A [Nocardioidaceae bacterium]|nr:malate synthase A [Nocardioidaceae bacterium]
MDLPAGVRITVDPRDLSEPDLMDRVLTSQALELIADLHRTFEPRRAELLAARRERARELDAGGSLDFSADTREIREDPDWRVADPAPGLEDRRVEITGPTDKKMAINALNSGAKVWLADLEDANSPLFENMLAGQANLRDSIDGTSLSFRQADGKEYALNEGPHAVPVVRPRGWHLPEKHVLVDDQPVSGGIFDFALYLLHSGQAQIDAGRGPYYYLPKMESHLEARLWNDVFVQAQEAVGIPRGTVRATVLIETYPAAFCMEEILYELREHSAGLNAGRWDYLFSVIKKFRTRGTDYLLPDRNQVTMTAPFMRAYAELLVRTCHKRGAHAIGGMAAFIPSRRDQEANEKALAKVREDKEREARAGYDGSWVAHPDLVPVCREIFDSVLGDKPNQRDNLREDVHVTAADLLDVKSTEGDWTEAGLRNNVSVGLQYLNAWLGGNGAVAIYGLMEDAATAEISRAQVWQWIALGVEITTEDGGTRKVTREWADEVIDEELERIREVIGDEAFTKGRYDEARNLYREMALSDDFAEFLTLPAYESMP